MSQFTPGPWTWNERPHECSTYHELTGSDGEKVIESAEYEGCWLSNHKHTEANADLIARAPTLLRERDELREALEAARSWLREYHACHTDAADDGLHGLSEQMDAVLSKVTP